ncbi:MAG: tyrosine--tRNA ligase [archaeon]
MVMSVDEKIELIKRNTCEIVGVEELRKLLKQGKQIVVYHGFEPSGEGLHIGTMIGINKHIDFQKAGLKLKLLCADLHAYLNKKGSLAKVNKIAELYREGFAALGVDMKKADYVLGSDFQLGHDYFLDVLKLSLNVRTLRAKRAMAIIAREEKDPHVAQMLYALMQTIDAKHLGVDISFGDLAQRKIHMLMREYLPILKHQAPIAIHHEDMVGLTGGKMSSSVPNSRIMIDEDPEIIRNKINKAFCPSKQIKDNPILQICKFIIFPRQGKLELKRDKKYGGDLKFTSYEKLELAYEKGLHPQDLKASVIEALIKILGPVRKHMSQKRIVELKNRIKEMN